MRLEPGSRLAHYEISEMIGKGGMGEVYRATDPRLPREVAIKTSETRFSDRFAREARVIASLNHPNICTLFDVGPDFLVMEMIDGPTLYERIKDGPLSLDDAASIMRQVADALDYAHERGVVHRDLKPGNIKIRPDGVVKVLDFGLAKVAVAPSSSAPDAASTTLGATTGGVVLGTAAYMSPEQVLGKPVDRRADVWAFGVVFYEMLTGARLIKGESAQEISASILKDEPDLSKVPPQARRILKRCLEKDPNKRLRHIGDVMVLLDDSPPSGPQITAHAPAALWRKWLWPAVASVASAAIFYWAPWRSTVGTAQKVVLEVFPTEGMEFNPGAAMTMSPDGRWMVFQAMGSDGVTRYWVRSIEGSELRQLLGTETIGVSAPPASWSFDSQWVFFATAEDPRLQKVDIRGGPPQVIAGWRGGLNGASENSDGVIIGGSSDPGHPILKVSKGSQTATPITLLAQNDSNHLFPQFLPDGKHFLYLRVSSDANKMGVYIGNIDAKPEEQRSERLLDVDREAYYAALPGSSTGHLIFMRQGGLMAQPFDPVSMTLRGDQIAIPGAEKVDSFTNRNYGIFSVSNTGTLAYRVGSGDLLNRLTWYDSKGKPGDTLGEADSYVFPAISPDGNHVAVAKGPESTRDIYILDSRGTSTHFTFNPADDDHPTWADSKNIVFSSNRNGPMDLYIGPADSPGQEKILLPTNERKYESHWTNGFLLFTNNNIKTDSDIWALPFPFTGEPKPVPLVNEKFAERFPRLSPDGRWLAYAAKSELGGLEIYVRRFAPEAGPNSGSKLEVSKGGGRWPVWRSDSKGVYYYSPQKSQLMTVDIDTSRDSPQLANQPQVMFRAPALTANYGWDLSFEGKRFLFIVPPGGGHTIPFTVKLNWAADLKQ